MVNENLSSSFNVGCIATVAVSGSLYSRKMRFCGKCSTNASAALWHMGNGTIATVSSSGNVFDDGVFLG